MKTVNDQLTEIKKTKKIGLMTHVVVGFPSLNATVQLVKDMAAAGADFVELQIPFSDPLADGPTIMRANDMALAQGVTLQDCFDVMTKLSKTVSIPLFFMGYFQTVFHVGVDTFCRKAKAAGAQGLIIPDMPIDEENYEHFIQACQHHKLLHIRVISPSSPDERLKLNAKFQNGFVYCTTRNGVTGAGDTLEPSLDQALIKIKQYITVPIAVGFGISQPEHLQALVGKADIAVVGSAIIDVITQEGIHAVPTYVKNLLSKV